MPDEVLIAHLLRRTGFGPGPGDVESWVSYDEALEAALAVEDDGATMPDRREDDATAAIVWWLERMRTSPAPLHDKLVLFWHGRITSSADKATADMMARQHDLLRRHALGDFRELLRALIHDAALLVFLDAAGSAAEAPNENLARELLELFTLGRGQYDEADVRAAAAALTGFTVDWDSEAVGFDEDAAAYGRSTILGVTADFDADRVVDVVCDQPACAPFVAGALHEFLTGTAPDDARRGELAATFRSSGLQIRPLVEDILRHPDFVEQRLNRPRFPVEWIVAARLAIGGHCTEDTVWNVEALGQLPLYPPNVAGWPPGRRWVSSGRQLLRAALAIGEDLEHIDLGSGTAAERADAALRRAGLFEVSTSTREAVVAIARRAPTDDGGDQLVMALALASPEMATC